MGGSVRLAKVVPDRKHRLSIRKLRLGMIGDTAIRACRQNLRASGDCPHCSIPQTVSHTVLHCPIGAPMRAQTLPAYSDAAAEEPYARPGLTFEPVLHHLLSNSSYMPKAHDVKFREKILPILTGCLNTLSATLYADNVQQTTITTGQDCMGAISAILQEVHMQLTSTTTITGCDEQFILNPPLLGGSKVSKNSTM